MDFYYAGIGSRDIPLEIYQYFEKLGKWFAAKGFVLRSGHAKGSDQAFEKGCDKVKGKKEIYVPWKNFEDSTSNLVVVNPLAFDIARKYHPRWHTLHQGAKKLQARNSHQVLGKDLKTANIFSKFIVCYTPNGLGSGGTGQAIRIAKGYGIPVFDVGKYSNIEDIKINLKAFLLKNTHLTEKDFAA